MGSGWALQIGRAAAPTRQRGVNAERVQRIVVEEW